MKTLKVLQTELMQLPSERLKTEERLNFYLPGAAAGGGCVFDPEGGALPAAPEAQKHHQLLGRPTISALTVLVK